MLARIEKLNPLLNAFNLVSTRTLDEGARRPRRAGSAGQPKGLLDGVPVSIKDIILTKGWPTLRGSKTVDPKGPWNDDAPVDRAPARARRGAPRQDHHARVRLEGRHRQPAHRHHAQSLEPGRRRPAAPPAAPRPRSPAGMGPLAVGTDGGGSIRIPCSFTGLFGIKPSFGRVPAWPLSPFGTVAHVGPMTRSVADAALMLNVIVAARCARLARPALRAARLARRPRQRRRGPAHRVLARTSAMPRSIRRSPASVKKAVSVVSRTSAPRWKRSIRASRIPGPIFQHALVLGRRVPARRTLKDKKPDRPGPARGRRAGREDHARTSCSRRR